MTPGSRSKTRHIGAGQRYLPDPTGFADSAMRTAQRDEHDPRRAWQHRHTASRGYSSIMGSTISGECAPFNVVREPPYCDAGRRRRAGQRGRSGRPAAGLHDAERDVILERIVDIDVHVPDP